MNYLKTIFTSNIPIECHIKKGRLEREGIECCIRDENFVCVDPFSAIAVGGVKLKVPFSQFKQANKILEGIQNGVLMDNKGEYKLSSILNKEIESHNEILKIKSEIRESPSLIQSQEIVLNNNNSTDILPIIIEEEKEFQRLKNLKFNFSMKQFFYELFDFDRSVFKYLRIRPVEYYIDKELVNSYNSVDQTKDKFQCPTCNSKNVSYGNAIDVKWDILWLFLSFIFLNPFPLIRKKYHCFECGNNVK